MLNKIGLEKPKIQFLIGFGVNVILLIVLYSFDNSYFNLQIPKGLFKNNIWQCSDVNTYVDPALNYLQHKIFGYGNNPDHFRTIGYPFIISILISFFGSKWLLALQLLQAFLFAFIYPLITNTIKILFPSYHNKFVKWVFLVLLLSGAYFTRTPVVLTDGLFALLFIAAFYYGLKTYIQLTFKHILLYFLFITIAALIRPTLFLMPVLNLGLAFWVVKQFNLSLKKIMFTSFILSFGIIVATNISTIRNAINYSYVSPSSVIGINAFEYLTKKILILENKTEEFQKLKDSIDSISDLTIKTEARKAEMKSTVLNYPISFAKVIFKNSINVFLTNHLVSNISRFFGYEWKLYKSSCFQFKTNKFLSALTYILMLCYAILWVLCLIKLIKLANERDFKSLIIFFILFGMFIVPAILTGDGGDRFRLPFEHVLVMFGLSLFFEKKGFSESQNPI